MIETCTDEWGNDVPKEKISNRKPRIKFKVSDIIEYRGAEKNTIDVLLVLKIERKLKLDLDRPQSMTYKWQVLYTVQPLLTNVGEELDVVTQENLNDYKVAA
jgi:hypothetical protein